MKVTSRNLAEVQYDGLSGVSLICLEAVMRRIHSGETIESALILTCESSHALLLRVVGQGPVVVKAGFASGYPGEGPRALADVLALLEDAGASIDEAAVDAGLMQRIEASSITDADLNALDEVRRVRPMRWDDYIYAVYGARDDRPEPWRLFSPLMPLGLIDSRIHDLAKRFKERPDEALVMAFRRLEESIRKRADSNESGTRLISQCLQGDKPKLRWEVSDPSEQVGRAQLFSGSFQAFRNPRAHREVERASAELWNEFLLLNHLFCLERQLMPAVAVSKGM